MKKAHCIGIKGSGMSALAEILLDLGYQLSGSDVEDYIFTQSPLEARGAKILPFNPGNIDDNMLVIVGNSFDDSHPEVQAAHANPTVICKRYVDQVGEWMDTVPTSIGICGTHGKTTTTAMVSALLKGRKRGYLIGDGSGQLKVDDDYFVVESDEFCDHFLSYHPSISLVTNIDFDHVDYFKTFDCYIQSFQTFLDQTRDAVVLCGQDEVVLSLDTKDKKRLVYGFDPSFDVSAQSIDYQAHSTSFDLYLKGQKACRITTALVGHHNLLNLLGAIGVALACELTLEEILEHLKDFKGTKRRFIVEKVGDWTFIDDYAHHPTEIKTTLEAVRLAFPNEKVSLIYKPDRISRLAYFEKDFMAAFDLADKVFVLDFPKGAYQVDPWFNHQDLLTFIDKAGATYVDNSLEGAAVVSQEGPGAYLFVSTKDVYKFKDLVKQVVENKKN